MTDRILLITGSVLMALAVAFGAFGAHIAEGMLTRERFDVYQTAVMYHFYHALGILIIGTLSMFVKESPWLGAVTPVGGIAFILGWIFAAAGIARANPKPKHI